MASSSEVGGDTGGGGNEASETSVMGDINVTPLVDVMLVLLIIFMIVTPMLLAGFRAEMPEGSHLKARREDDERTMFGIDQDGNWYLNKKPIRKEDAQKLLESEFLKHPDDKVLFVKADRNLKYGEMIKVMEVAKKAGVAVVAAVTESKPGTEAQLEHVAN